MEKKYKCHNKNKYDVGISFMDQNRAMNVKGGSFALLSADEIAYLHSISTTFSGKDLSVDDAEINSDILGFEADEKLSLSKEEIQAILKSGITKMKTSLESITEENFKYLIFEEAKKMYTELTGAKIDYIAQYCGKESEDMKPVVEEDTSKNKVVK